MTTESDIHKIHGSSANARGTPTICTPLAEVTERVTHNKMRLVAIAGEDGRSGPLGDVIADTEEHRTRIREVEMTLSRWMGIWLLIGMSGGELLRAIISRMSA